MATFERETSLRVRRSFVPGAKRVVVFSASERFPLPRQAQEEGPARRRDGGGQEGSPAVRSAPPPPLGSPFIFLSRNRGEIRAGLGREQRRPQESPDRRRAR